MGWYRPNKCENCIYTGAQGAPPGTKISVYTGVNAEFNCNTFEPYKPGSPECSFGFLDNSFIFSNQAASDCGRLCMKESEIDLRTHKKISGPYFDPAEC